MRTALMLLTAAFAIGSTACKKAEKKEPPPPTTGSGSAMAGSDTGSGSAVGSGSDTAAAAGSGSDAAGSGSDARAPEMARKAGNCPSTVFGAITKADVKGKDVVLTIQSEDKDAVAAIQRRTESLLKEKNEGGKGAAHDQKGTHGGGIGLCPVFFGEGGTATSKQNAKGVTITITPKEKPEELKAVIDERITKAADFVDKNIKPADEGNTGGVGGGKGEHGSTHKGSGDAKGKERGKDGMGGGKGSGGGGGAGTGGGGGKGTGAGAEKKEKGG